MEITHIIETPGYHRRIIQLQASSENESVVMSFIDNDLRTRMDQEFTKSMLQELQKFLAAANSIL